MKKLLFLIVVCFSFSVNAATKLIVAERKTDADGPYVNVMVWGKADGSYIQRKVTTASFLTKLASIANKNITGLTKNTDRILIWFNVDGSVSHIDCHVKTTNNTESFQSIIISKSGLPAQTITDIGTLKTATEALP